MNWVLALVASIAFVEIFLRLDALRRAKRITQTCHRSMRTISYKRASDHWKEKVMLSYSGRMMADSLLLGGSILLAAAPFPALGLLMEGTAEPFLAFAASLTGLIACTVFAIVYVMLRNRLAGN